jgi:hypothetical protein
MSQTITNDVRHQSIDAVRGFAVLASPDEYRVGWIAPPSPISI